MERYDRHIILEEIGPEGQDRIHRARILMIGAGGLGCPTLQYLAAAGVGRIGIMDDDTVEESNLQRQVLFGAGSLGKNKAQAAKERLLDLNPTIRIDAYPFRLTSENALDLFSEYDIIIDGSDNIPTRYLVNDASILSGKPMIFGAIYKFEGQVSVFNYQEGPSYRCLFPNPEDHENTPNCSDVGVLGVLPGIIGTMQANEALKIILNLGDVLSGKVLYYNARTSSTHQFDIRRKAIEIEKARTRTLREFSEVHCSTNHRMISLTEIGDPSNILWVDVRELDEEPRLEHPEIISLPLSGIHQSLLNMDSKKMMILFCQRGQRSKKALDILRQRGYPNVFSLKEGAIELLQYLNIPTHEER
ncbi:MAG: HesA/MoeB/ThiF family protein [Bacteroidota bacterium]|nr:HesA/MoeB/ThiF family protein [Bacteroidota bacterium]